MIRKALALAALLLSLIVVGAHPAAAGGGPSDYAECTVQVAPPQFAAGRTVTVIGRGFEPNFLTTIFFDGDTEIGTAMTNAQGRFTTRVTTPADAGPGPHTISAICDSQGNVSSSDVSVSSGAVVPPAAAPLASTGSNSTEPLVVAGGLALLAGVAFVVVAKRRRKSHAVA